MEVKKKIIIEREISRYSKKGYGTIVALIVAVTYFAGGPTLMRKLWPLLDEYTGYDKLF
jgi:hypothetical protein